MSTRANIELYDGWEKHQGKSKWIVWKKGAVLYHHHDGYPSWMGPELERILKTVKQELDQAGYSYWWDSERVAALMVKLSADDSEFYKGVPRFQPCLNLHIDINYLWRVFLGPKDGAYDIQCFSIVVGWDKDMIETLEPVDWRKEAKRQKGR